MKTNWTLAQGRLWISLGCLGMAVVLGLLVAIEQFLLGQYHGVVLDLAIIPLLMLIALLHLVGKGKPIQHYLIALSFFAIGTIYCVHLTYDSESIYLMVAIVALSFLQLPRKLARKLTLLLGVQMTLVVLLEYSLTSAFELIVIYFFCGFSLVLCQVSLTRKQQIFDFLSLRDIESSAYKPLHFDALLPREVDRARASDSAISLIGLGIEDFSQIKEIYGEAAVAEFLPDFVEKIRQEIRAGDEIFRLREDLFVLLLSDCQGDNAIVMMERIKRHLEHRQWPLVNDITLQNAMTALRDDESAADLNDRLMRRLAKIKRANLEASAF